jgi:hypothetical protein
MDNSRLHPELEHVERLLACGPRAEPATALRRRVLDDVHEELRHCVLHRLRVELLREQKRASRRFAVACAAMLLLAVGFSISIIHAVGVGLKPPVSAPSVVDVAWQLQQISPEISQKDLLLQATLRHIGPDAAWEDLLKNVFSESKSHDR